MSSERAQAIYDGVVRRQHFEADYPGLKIEHKTAPDWYWVATWSRDGQVRIATERDLARLLDRLDELFP